MAPKATKKRFGGGLSAEMVGGYYRMRRAIVMRATSADRMTKAGVPLLVNIPPGQGGVTRSRVFPGPWIDGQALLNQDASRLVKVVQQGIASTAHAAFVRRLERARRRSS
jgi:hypothetical protein